MFLELFKGKAPLPKGAKTGICQEVKELLMVIPISHHCCHRWDFRCMRGQMADERVGPVLSQLLLKGPLGSWFQVPQLGRSPTPSILPVGAG